MGTRLVVGSELGAAPVANAHIAAICIVVDDLVLGRMLDDFYLLNPRMRVRGRGAGLCAACGAACGTAATAHRVLPAAISPFFGTARPKTRTVPLNGFHSLYFNSRFMSLRPSLTVSRFLHGPHRTKRRDTEKEFLKG